MGVLCVVGGNGACAMWSAMFFSRGRHVFLAWDAMCFSRISLKPIFGNAMCFSSGFQIPLWELDSDGGISEI